MYTAKYVCFLKHVACPALLCTTVKPMAIDKFLLTIQIGQYILKRVLLSI